MATYALPDMPSDHAAYMKSANNTLDRLAEAREKGDFSGLVDLEKTFAFNLSGHWADVTRRFTEARGK